MSAVNWAVCPQCSAKAQAEFEAERQRVADMYGKVPVAEFDAARAANQLRPVGHTFREDYEFYGAESGTVHASYGGACTECGLSVSLSASKTFWP